jgi:hypothetical protein
MQPDEFVRTLEAAAVVANEAGDRERGAFFSQEADLVHTMFRNALWIDFSDRDEVQDRLMTATVNITDTLHRYGATLGSIETNQNILSLLQHKQTHGTGTADEQLEALRHLYSDTPGPGRQIPSEIMQHLMHEISVRRTDLQAILHELIAHHIVQVTPHSRLFLMPGLAQTNPDPTTRVAEHDTKQVFRGVQAGYDPIRIRSSLTCPLHVSVYLKDRRQH